MQVLSLVWGLLALVGMTIAFVPCLGSLNWLNIPFAGLGLVVSLIALFTGPAGKKGGAIGGVICCSLAVVVGLHRLTLGGGFF